MLIPLRICLITLLTDPIVILFAAKNEIGKLNIAPITVPAHAINKDSKTFGIILSNASELKSKGNIAPTKVAICAGALSILSRVISKPDADQIAETTIKLVNEYLNILWFNGCFGMFIIFFFLTKR